MTVCEWVRMVALGYRAHDWTKKQYMGTHLLPCRAWFGPYGREISLNMMFCESKANWTQTALGGHVGDWMGVVAYIFTGGARKREEMSTKNVDQGILCRCGHARKNNCLAGMVEGGREGKRWGISIKLGAYRESMDVYKKKSCNTIGK